MTAKADKTAEEIAATSRTRRIAGLRALADLFEQNPNLPVPPVYISAYVATIEEARSVRQGTHGWKKTNYKSSSYFNYSLQMVSGVADYEGVNYYIEVPKTQTCEKVQVGTQHVDAVPEHDEPIYEWRCEPTDDEIATGEEAITNGCERPYSAGL